MKNVSEPIKVLVEGVRASMLIIKNCNTENGIV